MYIYTHVYTCTSINQYACFAQLQGHQNHFRYTFELPIFWRRIRTVKMFERLSLDKDLGQGIEL